jgi:mono/diheme cytochrome c family protein
MTAKPSLLLGALLLLAGCDQRMIKQDKDIVWGDTKLFGDDKVVQAPPPGTVARGELAYFATLGERPEMSAQLLARGQERFNIFCAPCHDQVGTGHGMIVQRGMPQPPSFHSERLRRAPNEHFLQVIANGYGAMYSYASRVPPADRWAIIAYIRALQLSQHAEVAALPADLRDRAEGGGQ